MKKALIAALLLLPALLLVLPGCQQSTSRSPQQPVALTLQQPELGSPLGGHEKNNLRLVSGSEERRVYSMEALDAIADAMDEYGHIDWSRVPAEYVPESVREAKLPPPAVSGNSQTYPTVRFCPTLSSSFDPKRNALWCASFQLAWQQLSDEVLKGPVKVVPANPVVDELNAAPFSKMWIPDGCAFAAAGYGDKGIVKRIEEGMKAFPDANVPNFKEYKGKKCLVSFGYLTSDVLFRAPFLDKPTGLDFTALDGTVWPVKGFGVLQKDYGRVYEREQVTVLYYASSTDNQPAEFALDLCKYSQPSQLVVACVKPEATLQATLEALEAKMKGWNPEEEKDRHLQDEDDLLVPTLGLSLLHSYDEILGAMLANPVRGQGWPFVRAEQKVDFLLTRWGAQLSSYGVDVALCATMHQYRHFVFDRPFLVYMKKRGEKTPYFAMWVADTTFMYPQEPVEEPATQ